MASAQLESWLGVEPRHLATLVAVARTGSFRRAAADLGYVVSAVSQHIVQLERAVGVSLVERGRGSRRVGLTDAGRALLAHAERVVDEVHAARADIAQLNGCPLRVALEPGTAQLLTRLTGVLGALRKNVELSIVEVSAAKRAVLVSTGVVDFAIGASDKTPNPGVAQRIVYTDRWILAVSASSALAALGSLDSVDALRDIRLIADPSEPLPPARSVLGPALVSCDGTAAALALVRAGVGCAIVPALTFQPDDGIVTVELTELLPPRPIVVTWQQTRRAPNHLDYPTDEPETEVLGVVA